MQGSWALPMIEVGLWDGMSLHPECGRASWCNRMPRLVNFLCLQQTAINWVTCWKEHASSQVLEGRSLRSRCPQCLLQGIRSQVAASTAARLAESSPPSHCCLSRSLPALSIKALVTALSGRPDDPDDSPHLTARDYSHRVLFPSEAMRTFHRSDVDHFAGLFPVELALSPGTWEWESGISNAHAAG